jgi:hypothetical protein
MNKLVLVEGVRRIAGREHDDHHLPVPRTNQAGKAPSIGPDGGRHHTGARRCALRWRSCRSGTRSAGFRRGVCRFRWRWSRTVWLGVR